MTSKLSPTVKPPKARHGKNTMTGITLAGQLPAIEHARDGHNGRVWRVWISYNDRYDEGMYLQLENDGAILRRVVYGGKITTTEVIKEPNR